MDEYTVLILIALVILVGPSILSIVAISRGNGTRQLVLRTQVSLDQALVQISTFRSEIRALRENISAGVAEGFPQVEPAVPVEDIEEGQSAPEDRVEEPLAPSQLPPDTQPADRAPGSTPTRWAAEQADAPLSQTLDTPAVEKQSFEELLASRWIVWLGAIVIALGSVFLVKFSIEQGWLGPAVRDALTLILGVALISGGEWLRRRPLQRRIAAIRPDYVPLALTASGLFAAFASIYAAHIFHGLIGPFPAFAGLAIVAVAAIGMSLLQGKFVALLGLLGAAATPFLIPASDPSLWALFTYLFAIQAACLALVYYKAWWSLGVGTLAFAGTWPVLTWLRFGGLGDADVAPLGIYLLLSAGAFFGLRHLMRGSELFISGNDWIDKLQKRPSDGLAWIAGLLIAGLMFVLVQSSEFSPVSLILLAAFSVLYLIVGRLTTVLEGLSVVAATVVVGLMVTWPDLYFDSQLGAYIEVFVFFGALFGVAGFAAMWGAERPALWAGVSIVVPLLLLIIAYWLIAEFTAGIWWIAFAVGLGAVSLAAAARVVVHREAYGLNISLGFYAAGVVAFVTLAATMFLEQAWLTVAMSVQLLALGWIYRQIPERSLEKIALILAGMVLVRLVVNPSILEYSLDSTWQFTWIIYGYGVPAITFFWAANLFRNSKAAILVPLLEAGCLVFSVLLVSFHIRLFVAGGLNVFDYSLLEQSLQTITWLTIGAALAIRHERRANMIALYGSRILLILAAAQIVFSQLLVSNPMQTPAFVGDYPLFNTLLLAYLVPAAFAFFLAQRFRNEKPVWIPLGSAILGFILIFAYLSFEVRRGFQGPVLSFPGISDAEFYTYSLVWLIYALVLLTIGITAKSTLPRYVSLAVLLITVLKAFLFDMADLSGLLRVSTFLILGLTLIGIGYLYQRFVFRLPSSATAHGEAEPSGNSP